MAEILGLFGLLTAAFYLNNKRDSNDNKLPDGYSETSSDYIPTNGKYSETSSAYVSGKRQSNNFSDTSSLGSLNSRVGGYSDTSSLGTLNSSVGGYSDTSSLGTLNNNINNFSDTSSLGTFNNNTKHFSETSSVMPLKNNKTVKSTILSDFKL